MQSTHKLLYQGDSKAFTEPQHIFAHMVKLAMPVLTSYESDLWHDALWLAKHAGKVVPGAALHFYWSLGPTHTWLGDHPIVDPYDGSVLYHFTLYLDEHTGWWTLRIEKEERTPRTTSRVCRACGEGGHQIGGQCVLCSTRPSTANR